MMSPSEVATKPDQETTPDVVANHGASDAENAPATEDLIRRAQGDLQRVLNLEVPVTAILAERDMNIESVLSISVGTIIEFDVPFDSNLTLSVANRTIGNGEAVKIGENFGLRINNIETVRDRIGALGGK